MNSGKHRVINAGNIIFIAALLVYFSTLNSLYASDHPTSFLELDYAMWKNHSFSLGEVGKFQPQSVDVFAYNGSYYSAFAPGTAFLSLPFAALGFALDGRFSLFGHAALFTEAFVALSNSIAVYFVYKLAKLYFDDTISFFIACSYAFSTISWPFATFFYQHDVSAMFAVMATYLFIRFLRDPEKLGLLLWGGLALGGAITVDYVNALLVPIFLAWVVFVTFRKGHEYVAKSVGMLLSFFTGLLVIAFYNLESFGKLFVSSEQLYFGNTGLLGGFSTPLYVGVPLNLLSPYRGLFIYSPVLLSSLFGFKRMLKGDRRKEGVLLISVFLAILLPYSAWYNVEGGLSFGPRFLIPAIPFLLLPAGFVIEAKAMRVVTVYFVLYLIGVVESGVGAMTSALGTYGGYYSSPFLAFSAPNFVKGNLDSWWLSFVGTVWPVTSACIIVVAVVLPAGLWYLSVRSEKIPMTYREYRGEQSFKYKGQDFRMKKVKVKGYSENGKKV